MRKDYEGFTISEPKNTILNFLFEVPQLFFGKM